jgi:hypothetical protein
MKNIEALIAEGGSVSIDAQYPHDCVAVASDEHNMLAAVVRRDDETLTALLKRLDKAIASAWSSDHIVDEINDGLSSRL